VLTTFEVSVHIGRSKTTLSKLSATTPIPLTLYYIYNTDYTPPTHKSQCNRNRRKAR